MMHLETKAGYISFQEDWNGLLIQASATMELLPFQELGNKVIELLKTMPVEYIMIDARATQIMRQEIISWIEQSWYPAVLETKLRRIAFVVPPIGLAELTLRQSNKKVEALNVLEIEYFGTWERARSWLCA